MRVLMWLALGFCSACGVGVWLLSGNLLLFLAAGALILAAGFWYLCHRMDRKPVPGVLLLGLAVGLSWYWVYDTGYLHPLRELDAVTTRASIEITDYSFDTDYGTAAEGIASWQGKEYRIRVYLNGWQDLEPGQTVSGTFRFHTTDGSGEKEASFHRGEGILLIAKAKGEVTVSDSQSPWWYYAAAHIREHLVRTISRVFPQDVEAFGRALLLGDDTDLSYEVNTAFKVTGIRHIIAVSGLHVSILFSLVYLSMGKHRVLTAVVGIPLLALFAAVAGMTPSVTRACLMHGLMMVGMLLNREYDRSTALSFAALAMAVMNPLVITSVSFQLSIGCMVGIFLFSEKIRNWLLDDKRLGHKEGKGPVAVLIRGFASSVSVSLAAISLTTPLSAWYFGAVSLISPLTNLLTLWVVNFVFYGILGVCVLAGIWAQGAQMLAWLIAWPIRYILGITDLLGRIPVAAMYTVADGVVWCLVLVYVLMAVAMVLKGRKAMVLSAIAAASLAVCFAVSWVVPRLDSFRMTVLDVGQGQCILLQSYGKTYVVDCGGSYADNAADMAAETLLSMGIRRIDGLILTHYDKDHSGGVELLLTRIDADVLYLPDWEDKTAVPEALADYDAGGVVYLDSDRELLWQNSKLTIIASESRESDNESSLCVLFQADTCDILITGDRRIEGEAMLMERLDLPELDVLVVGHHGSKYSTGQALLEQTRPRIAVISVSATNSYGHPTQEVLDRLAAIGCTVLRTDEDGTVIIRR